MGLHKADFIFHSRPPPHFADNPRSPFLYRQPQCL